MSWNSLPAELRAQIVGHFELPRPELGSRLPSREYLNRRATLWNLCLTCRSAAVEAQSWLYRTIILFLDFRKVKPSSLGCDQTTSPASSSILFVLNGVTGKPSDNLVPLLRTLAHNPALRLHIKYLACALPISGGILRARHESPSDRELQRATWTSWLSHNDGFSHLPEFARRVLDIAELPAPRPIMPHTRRLGLEGSDDIEDGIDTIAEKTLAALFCLLPEVDTLLIEGVDKWPCDVTPMILEELLKDEATASAVLPKLATLQIQLHNVSRDSRNPERPMVSFDAIYALLNLPTLRHIETWHVDGFQSFFDVYSSRPDHNESRTRVNLRQWLPKIESLSLSSVNHHCSDFYAACRVATNLRRLALDAVGMHRGHSESHSPPHLEALSSALLLRAETLEELRLAGFERHALKHLSWSYRLTCLPSMTKLRILTLDVFMLFGPSGQIDRLWLPDLLPPNLERLDLCDRWSDADADYGDFLRLHPELYVDALARQLLDLAAAVQPRRREEQEKGRLSRLRAVHLRPGPRCARHRWLQALQLRHVEQAFDRAGVSFTYVLAKEECHLVCPSLIESAIDL
ncbi:hypothetical protein PG985_005348 [Apiospora marii]|uniref:F-box domain-containing protein n=1 Tax=Apiospora marii TaxID=335849 RepID=A0ABR1SBQ1_9PEZI